MVFSLKQRTHDLQLVGQRGYIVSIVGVSPGIYEQYTQYTPQRWITVVGRHTYQQLPLQYL